MSHVSPAENIQQRESDLAQARSICVDDISSKIQVIFHKLWHMHNLIESEFCSSQNSQLLVLFEKAVNAGLDAVFSSEQACHSHPAADAIYTFEKVCQQLQRSVNQKFADTTLPESITVSHASAMLPTGLPLCADESTIDELKLCLHALQLNSFNLPLACSLHSTTEGRAPPLLLYYVACALKSIPYRQSRIMLALNEFALPPSAPLIGQGSFGKVFKCSYNGKLVAVKMFDESVTGNTFDKIMRLWAELKAENIVPLMASSSFDAPLFAVMPYYPNGNLRHYLQYRSLAELELLNMACDITAGLNQLHSVYQVCHGDLRADNVLVDCNGRGLLSDFDMARSCIGDSWMRVTGSRSPVILQGAHRWMSPARHLTGETSKEDDIYALGMTFWQIWTRSVPFPDIGEAHVKNVVIRGSRPARPPVIQVSTEVWWIMNDCWDSFKEVYFDTTAVQYRLQMHKGNI